MWRWVGVRGAGFPCSFVLKLGFPECGIIADEVIRVEEDAEQARQIAIKAMKQEMSPATDEQKQAVLRKALRRIRKGRPPGEIGFEHGARQEVAAFESALAQVDLAKANYQRAFESAIEQSLQATRQFAESKRFREALIWQNRKALRTALDPMLRRSAETGSRSSKYRQHEELIANYVQRYCVKNDTIGFFGPVGWAKLVPEGDAINALPGPELLASRKVYFEAWGIESLTERLDENKAYLPWATPRRTPGFHLDGTLVYQQSDPPYTITQKQLTLIQACDGDRIAKEIAQELVADPASGFESVEEVYAMMSELVQKELLVWQFEIPFQAFSERALRSVIERIDDASLREPALKALDELESCRDAVARAAGDPDELDQALEDLENTFNRITGHASTRAGGQMYAARTLIYEDCVRDLKLEIGPDFLKSVGPPLSLLLASVRWFTHEIAVRYRKVFNEVYRDLAQETGSPTVSAISFWEQVGPKLFSVNTEVSDGIVKDLQERWAEILRIPPGQRHVQYSADELRDRVLTAFDAPKSGWALAHYCCPDLMIAAPNLEAIKRGDYQPVLGEIHLASNTLGYSFFLDNHPAPQELKEAAQIDLPDPILAPATPKRWNGLVARTMYVLDRDKDFLLEISPDSFGGPNTERVRIADVVLEEMDGIPVVRTRDGRLQFDLLDALSHFLMQTVIESFRILPRTGYKPRISIDRMVICRESWAYPVSGLDFAHIKDEAELFIAARRWARSQNIPRFVFMKAPIEVKPVFIDFDSPVYVIIFAKLIRRTRNGPLPGAEVTITEMFPDLTQTWLPDAEGQTYTSELRIVAVDPVR